MQVLILRVINNSWILTWKMSLQEHRQDIADKGRQQQNQAQASAVGSGAFGGSRQAVLQGQIAADTMDQQARTGAQLRSQGFAQAQNLAQQQANQALRQAQLTGQTVGCVTSWSWTTWTTNGCTRH